MSKPIDPTDYKTLMDLFQRAEIEAHPRWEPYSIRVGAVTAVARAVLPEGYVAVPITEIQAVCSLLGLWGDMESYERLAAFIPEEVRR